jgi:hypothetical protein
MPFYPPSGNTLSVILLTLAIAGCGGSDGSNSTPPAPSALAIVAMATPAVDWVFVCSPKRVTLAAGST